MLVLGSLGGAAVLGVASSAWACGEVAGVHASISVTPARGPATTLVHVTGATFDAEGNVAIRFDDTPLGMSTIDDDGRFVSEVRIPTASIGQHAIVAVSGDQTAAFPFDVTEPATTSTGAPGETIDDGGISETRTSGRLGPVVSAVDPPALAAPVAAADARAAGQTSDPAPTGAIIAEQDTARSRQDGGLVAGTGPRGGGESGDAAGGGPPDGGGGVGAEIRTSVSPPAGSAEGDLWSAFASVRDGDAPARGLAGLNTPGRGAEPFPLAVGAGIGLIGLLALLGGFATAMLGRRPVTARHDGSGQ